MFFACFLFLSRSIDREPFHPDENNYIYYSRHFKLLFMEGDVRSPEWTGPFACAPPLETYLVGLALWVTGDEQNERDLARLRLWDFSRSVKWNFQNGSVPSWRILKVARRVSALFGAMTCVVVYGLGRKLMGAAEGALACGLLVLIWCGSVAGEPPQTQRSPSS